MKDSNNITNKTEDKKINTKRIITVVSLFLVLVLISAFVVSCLLHYTGNFDQTNVVTLAPGDDTDLNKPFDLEGNVKYRRDDSLFKNQGVSLDDTSYSLTDEKAEFKFETVSVGGHEVAAVEDQMYTVAKCDIDVRRSKSTDGIEIYVLARGSYLIKVGVDVKSIFITFFIEDDGVLTIDQGGCDRWTPYGYWTTPRQATKGVYQKKGSGKISDWDSSNSSSSSQSESGKVTVYDLKKVWTQEGELVGIFDDVRNGGNPRNYLYPGASGQYEFCVQNTNAFNVEYDMSITDLLKTKSSADVDLDLPMQFKLAANFDVSKTNPDVHIDTNNYSDSDFFGGDRNRWYTKEQLQQMLLQQGLHGKTQLWYTLIWRWDPSNDVLDTTIGKTAASVGLDYTTTLWVSVKQTD